MNYSEEEKEIIEQVKEELKRVHKINHLSGTYVPIDYLEIMLNLIQKQDKIIDYSIDRILPSPEEYLEIKNIMKQNKWGYDRSKKEYFKKVVDEDVKD